MTEAQKNIEYNCRQATFLIEKRTSGELTTAETEQLQIHLAGCSVCRTYQQQSLLINRLFIGLQSDTPLLDEEFKTSLQQRIVQEMNKN